MKNSEEYAAIFMEVTAEIEGKSIAERIDILYGLYGKPLEEFPGMTEELKEMCNKMDPMERIRLSSDIVHVVERSVGMVATLWSAIQKVAETLSIVALLVATINLMLIYFQK